MKVGRRAAKPADGDTVVRPTAAGNRRGAGVAARKRRPADGPVRPARPRAGTRTRPQESRAEGHRPQTAPAVRPSARPARATSSTQAKARAKARKAKAPRVIRPPLRDRILARLARIDLSPRALLARIPFVVLVIGALAVGLAVTLWLSTDAAQRSYQLSNARALNDALTQQKEALERDVLQAQSAPALADAARNLGMIPSRDTAHLVLDPAGNWVVVGQPKAAEGASPPPLNTKLPEPKPAAPERPAPPAAPAVPPKPGAEVPQLSLPARGAVAAPPEVSVLVGPASPDAHIPTGALPGLPPVPGPASAPVVPPPAGPASAPVPPAPGPGAAPVPPAGDTLAVPPAAPAAPPVPTVADVPPVTPVAPEVIAGGGPR